MKDNSIELPPLPEARIVSYQTDSTMRRMELRTHSDEDMRDYARQAVEADRKRRGEPVAWLGVTEDTRYGFKRVEVAQWNPGQLPVGDHPVFTAPQPQQIPEGYKPSVPEPLKYGGKWKDHYVTGWNNCRAAMLEAAPDPSRDSDGNHPIGRNPDAL